MTNPSMKQLTMKHTLTARILFALVALCVVSSVAFAGDPIPGIGVGAGKNPGGTSIARTKTGDDGKFTFSKSEAGSYTITFAAQDVKNMMAIAGKKYHKTYGAVQGAVLTLQPSSTMTVNGQKRFGPIALSVTKTTTITIVLTKQDSISGSLTTADATSK